MEKFLQTYTILNRSNLHLLSSIYTEDIIFIDPAHRIEGLPGLSAYFEALYQNINSIDFAFTDPLQVKDLAYVQWTMSFSHPKLKKGDVIKIPGMSFLKFHSSGKVTYHRDQFDLGSMLYEHLPVLGQVVNMVKRRLGQ